MIPLTSKAHIDSGRPAFARTPDTHTITLQEPDRGRYLIFPEPMPEPGTPLEVRGSISATPDALPALAATFWHNDGCTDYSHTRPLIDRPQTDFAVPFTMPAGCSGLRLEFRFWRGSGAITLRNLQLTAAGSPPGQPEPDPPPADPPPPDSPPPDPANTQHTTGLPVPPVAGRAVPISGYQWGRIIMLLIHDQEDEEGSA